MKKIICLSLQNLKLKTKKNINNEKQGRCIFIYLFNRIFSSKFGKEEEIKIKAKKMLHRENKISRKNFFYL